MNWKDLKDRPGTFTLHKTMLIHNIIVVKRLLSKMLIYKAEFIDFGGAIIRYTGCSELFDIVPQNEKPYEYELCCTYTEIEKDCVLHGCRRKKGDRVLTEIIPRRIGNQNGKL